MAKIKIIKAYPGSPKVGSKVTLDPRVEKFYASPKHKEFYKIIIEVGDYIVFLKSFDDCKEGDVVRIDKVEKENKSSSMHSGIWLSYLRPNKVNGGFKIKTTSNGYTYGEDFRLATEKEITSISTFPELCEKVIEKDYKILSLARFCSIKPTILLVSDYGDEYIEALLKCDNARIHSIERLSDGVVFTIGDKVHLTNGNYYGFELKEFKFFHNGKNGHLEKHRNKTFLKFGIISDLHKESTFFYLEDITKTKQPLVKTEEELLYFKTREEAEEYRMLNKPCLTLKNVLEAAEFPLFDFEGKLRTIVKNTMKYD